jgi:acetyl-CoA acetyltransferase
MVFASQPQKAVEALSKGYFKEETLPLDVPIDSLGSKGRRRPVRFDSNRTKVACRHFDGRPGEAEACLPCPGHGDGGNSSQMSDGAAAAIVTSRKPRAG